MVDACTTVKGKKKEKRHTSYKKRPSREKEEKKKRTKEKEGKAEKKSVLAVALTYTPSPNVINGCGCLK